MAIYGFWKRRSNSFKRRINCPGYFGLWIGTGPSGNFLLLRIGGENLIRTSYMPTSRKHRGGCSPFRKVDMSKAVSTVGKGHSYLPGGYDYTPWCQRIGTFYQKTNEWRLTTGLYIEGINRQLDRAWKCNATVKQHESSVNAGPNASISYQITMGRGSI